MTAEKQYVDEFESAYQGKAWSKIKIFGIMLVVCVAMVIRDIGMMFVYGSIYDKRLLEGADAGISFFNYVFMVLLYALPLVLPMILRFTGGAYDNEIEGSLLPSFNSKALNVIMYIVVGALCIVPLVLFMVGLFTAEYMFVALNLALLIFTSVAVFYYLGTYMLQRAKASLAKKYTLPTIMMVIVSAVASVVSIGIGVALHFLKVSTAVTHLITYFEKQVLNSAQQIVAAPLIELLVQAGVMLVVIVLACIIAGLLYNLTQNMIYASVPVFVFSFANIVLIQRIKEASSYLSKATTDLSTYKTKLAEATSKNNAKDITNYTLKIEELEGQMPLQQIGMIICYILIACMVVALAVIGIRALIGLGKNLKEAKRKN